MPSGEDLPARVSGVLAVLFLVFNEGYLATGPDTDPVRQTIELAGNTAGTAYLTRRRDQLGQPGSQPNRRAKRAGRGPAWCPGRCWLRPPVR